MVHDLHEQRFSLGVHVCLKRQRNFFLIEAWHILLNIYSEDLY